MIAIPNHTPIERLGGTAGQREVWRTEFAGRTCVTRIIARDRLHANLAASIRGIVLGGRGSAVNLPENVQLTIEGYRVAANLPGSRGLPADPTASDGIALSTEPRWPRALDAGLTAEGFVYVTTEWIEGAPLARLQPVPPHLRIPIARGVGRILAVLHGANVAYGDLKAENLVIGPNGDVSLIDLDTMREVPGPTLAVPTRDLTLSWAAPEQRAEQQTYLASDLWAFGRLVRELFPDEVPEPWRDMIGACAHPRPLDRPRTTALVARLHDPEAPLFDWHEQPLRPPGHAGVHEPAGEDRTQRVEEPPAVEGRTERVAEGPSGPLPEAGPPVPPATRPPATPTGGTGAAGAGPTYALRSCLLIPLIGGVLGLLTCAGLVTWWDRSQIALANEGADEALAALKSYKTRPDVNSDTSQRAAIRVQADAAFQTRATPHATAVRALAVAWEQGWQDAGQKWDQKRYDNGIAALEGAAEEPAAWMARATVEGGACRENRGDARSAGHCDRALDAIETLEQKLPAEDDWQWLRVEALWTKVLVRGELAEQAVAARSGEADKRLADVLETCDSASQWLAFGPVNAIELEQDCLDYAGLAGDWTRYFNHADFLFAHDQVADVVPKVYRAAGGDCKDTSVSKRKGDWVVKGDPWCTAVGHAARGCYTLAQRVIVDSAPDAPDRAWDPLIQEIGRRAAGGETCRR